MEFLLPELSVELVLFAFPVLILFMIVLQFGFVNGLGENSGISQRGFAVALLVLLSAPILIMARTVVYYVHPEAINLYGIDMLMLLIVWGGLFYTLINISSRMKPSKMMFLQRASGACSSVFAFMFVGALLHV